MKKIFAILLCLTLPLGTFATEYDEDLHVKISDDLTVKAGEIFTLEVKEAYDDLERCSDFIYNWRQTAGPVGVSPLNSDVLAPQFQIFTTGEYTFSLFINANCGGSDIISEPVETNITVEPVDEDITSGQWEESIFPKETTLPADGMTTQTLTFYLEHSYDGVTEYPDDEKVEVSFQTDNEFLKNNIGNFTLGDSTTKNGRVNVIYTTPLVENVDFSEGDITVQFATSHGETQSTLHLKKPTYIAQANLEVAQVLDDFPYLTSGKMAVGRMTLDWLGETEKLSGDVMIFINDEEVVNKEDSFYQTYTAQQIADKENSVDFYFTPTGDSITIGAYFKNDEGSAAVEKTYKVRAMDTYSPAVYALAEGAYADLETVDFSGNAGMLAKKDFLISRLPHSATTLDLNLTQIHTVKRENITEDMIIILPDSVKNTDLTNAFYTSDDDNILARKIFARTEDPSADGVILLDDDFEEITSETPTIFVDSGVGLDKGNYLNFLETYVINPSFSDLNTDHWAYDYIQNFLSAGLLSGYQDGTFAPNDPITRAEFIKLLLTTLNIEVGTAQGNTPLTDSSRESWYAPYAEYAYFADLITGYDDNTLRPAQSITRAEALKVLISALDYKLPTEVSESNFSDVDSDSWYAPYIQIATEKDLVSGYADGTFLPNNPITRAEAVKVLSSLL